MSGCHTFYEMFRTEFPEISSKVDEIHQCLLGADIGEESPALWFESFSKLVNSEMNIGIEVLSYRKVFEFLRKQYMLGDDRAKDIIDVSIIENLFWQVTPSRAKIYWDDLPAVFKELYVEFHGKSPA